jgi:hypothetical protein
MLNKMAPHTCYNENILINKTKIFSECDPFLELSDSLSAIAMCII